MTKIETNKEVQNGIDSKLPWTMNSLLYQHHYSLSETDGTRTQYLRTTQNITKATTRYTKSKVLHSNLPGRHCPETADNVFSRK
jgi:hypothetical protein